MKRNRKTGLPVKLLVTVIIIFIALVFVIGYIWKALIVLEAFRIGEIIYQNAGSADLSYLKGKNIFSVNLRKESRDILNSYPGYSQIRLVRVLPDRIFVGFVERRPVALVKLYRYFAIDAEGAFFNPPGPPQGEELPVILGLETKIFGPKPGARYNTKELQLALRIIREISRNRALRDYKIKKIDVSDPAQASFFVSWKNTPGMPFAEVKIGQSDIEDRVMILSGLLAQHKLDLGNIKYIDLRFKEPVVKFNNVKTK